MTEQLENNVNKDNINNINDETESDKDSSIEYNSKKIASKKQMIFLSSIIAIVFISFCLIWLFKNNQAARDEVEEDDNTATLKLDAGSTALDTDKMWRHKVEENLNDQSKDLNSKLESIKQDINENTQVSQDKNNQRLQFLEEKITFLDAALSERNDSSHNSSIELGNSLSKLPKISRHTVNLSNGKNTKEYEPLKTADNYIAAGAFVKAVLLSGIDVSTAGRTMTDPEPVLIRLVDFGTLPRKFRSDLKDCHIIASAYGELSSERAKMRIEKLSCTEIKTGEIVETEVAGYVSGEDGRSGLRGEVVSIDQKYLVNAQIFGTLGGLADTAIKDQSAYNPFTIGMGAVKPLTTKEKVGNNLMSGAGNSLEKLADYYISRADQIAPVIQVAAGRQVDVVFTKGVYFGTSVIKKSLAKKRDENIKNVAKHESSSLVDKMNKFEGDE